MGGQLQFPLPMSLEQIWFDREGMNWAAGWPSLALVVSSTGKTSIWFVSLSALRKFPKALGPRFTSMRQNSSGGDSFFQRKCKYNKHTQRHVNTHPILYQNVINHLLGEDPVFQEQSKESVVEVKHLCELRQGSDDGVSIIFVHSASKQRLQSHLEQ